MGKRSLAIASVLVSAGVSACVAEKDTHAERTAASAQVQPTATARVQPFDPAWVCGKLSELMGAESERAVWRDSGFRGWVCSVQGYFSFSGNGARLEPVSKKAQHCRACSTEAECTGCDTGIDITASSIAHNEDPRNQTDNAIQEITLELKVFGPDKGEVPALRWIVRKLLGELGLTPPEALDTALANWNQVSCTDDRSPPWCWDWSPVARFEMSYGRIAVETMGFKGRVLRGDGLAAWDGHFRELRIVLTERNRADVIDREYARVKPLVDRCMSLIVKAAGLSIRHLRDMRMPLAPAQFWFVDVHRDVYTCSYSDHGTYEIGRTRWCEQKYDFATQPARPVNRCPNREVIARGRLR